MYSLGGQAQAKRRKTTAERKAEDEAKRAERQTAKPDEPWSLQVAPSAHRCNCKSPPCALPTMLDGRRGVHAAVRREMHACIRLNAARQLLLDIFTKQQLCICVPWHANAVA